MGTKLVERINMIQNPEYNYNRVRIGSIKRLPVGFFAWCPCPDNFNFNLTAVHFSLGSLKSGYTLVGI